MTSHEILRDVVADLGMDRPVLIQGISGFLDAGQAGQLAATHLNDSLGGRVVARFDLDRFIDYRARRPLTVFDTDHYESIEMPEMVVRECIDEVGNGFLVLSGPEPDTGWRAVTSALLELVDLWDVGLVLGMQGVPFPVPHTRPIQVTAHGTDPSLLEGRQSFVGRVEVPGSLNALLELSLAERRRTALTLIAHVPHYLSATPYWRASVRMLEETSAITGLILPMDSVRERADATDSEISAHISGDEENLAVVRTLEGQFDALMAERGVSTTSSSDLSGQPLPTGDELAAAVEQFLADLDRDSRGDT